MILKRAIKSARRGDRFCQRGAVDELGILHVSNFGRTTIEFEEVESIVHNQELMLPTVPYIIPHLSATPHKILGLSLITHRFLQHCGSTVA